MRILFIFIDGLGIGVNDLKKNPFAQKRIKLFDFFQSDSFPKTIPFDGIVKPIDAQLGVPGLPQSATGQATLFTGINAARMLNKHLSGFPNSVLRQLLSTHSIHIKLINRGKNPAFINVYRPIFFERGPEELIRYLSVTSIANWKANLKFYDFHDLRSEQAIYHDFTNIELINRGFQVPQFSAEKAGQILAHASRKYDFCLFEYFKTDAAGHAQDFDCALQLLSQLEKFIETILVNINLQRTLVILTSDHGNIEDLSVKTHTSNPVPLMTWGKHKDEFIKNVESLTDVTPQVLKIIGI